MKGTVEHAHEYLNKVNRFLQSDWMEYEDVKALSDEGYALIRKLQRSIEHFEKLKKHRGKYAPIFQQEIVERSNLIDLIEDKISELWGEFRRRRRVRWI